MSAVPTSTCVAEALPVDQAARNELFLRFLPAVETHAKIQFRHLRKADREEAVAEATAAALVLVHQASSQGRSENLTPSSVARFSVLHVRAGRHVGGCLDGAKDVLSRRAHRRRGFRVLGLSWDSVHGYDAIRDGATPVWQQRLAGQVKPTPAEQAAFRIDFSQFLRNQSGRTRQALALLAAGYRQVEVAEKMGVTASSVCQRQKRAEREWRCMQGEPVMTEQPS